MSDASISSNLVGKYVRNPEDLHDQSPDCRGICTRVYDAAQVDILIGECQNGFDSLKGAYDSLHATFIRLSDETTEVSRLRAALGLMYDKWEDGVTCWEDGDDSGISLGNAFKLMDEEEREILSLIPSQRSAVEPSAPCAACEGWPKEGNNPCAVCGLDTRPVTTEKATAWLCIYRSGCQSYETCKANSLCMAPMAETLRAQENGTKEHG